MAYRQAIFANQEVYHIFNRGVEKRITFEDKRDCQRFIQTLDYYRFEEPPARFSFKSRPIFQKSKKTQAAPIIEVICYCLMPNHFHLLLKQAKEGGISTYLSKVTNSYTKYFNTKRKRPGPLFQGTFKAVRIEDDEQLLHVSRYIHLNPLIDFIVRNLRRFPFSSYPQFLGLEEGFCRKEEILDHFKSPADYEKFVLDQEDYGRKIKQIERLLLEEVG